MSNISYFFIYKDAANQWRWRFVATNGKIIAVSSESYINLADCEAAAMLVRKESAGSPIIGDENYKKLRP